MAVNPDHLHIFIEYLPKYSVSYISKMIEGRGSRVLRKEFPYLGMLGTIYGVRIATTVLWALAGTWLRNISRHIIHMSIKGSKYEKIAIYRPGAICPGYTMTANRLTMLELEYNIHTSLGAAIQTHM